MHTKQANDNIPTALPTFLSLLLIASERERSVFMSFITEFSNLIAQKVLTFYNSRSPEVYKSLVLKHDHFYRNKSALRDRVEY